MQEIIYYCEKRDFLLEVELKELYATGKNYSAATEAYNYKDSLVKSNHCEFEENNIDVYQKLIEIYILSPFFPWLLLILILNRKNWKRPIIFILIMYWIFRSTGDLLNWILNLIYSTSCNYEYILWPYNLFHWKLGCLSNLFLKSSEIIGDWYILLRTNAVIRKSRKMFIIYITCIIYNITKLSDIFYRFYIYPDLFIAFNDYTHMAYDYYTLGDLQKIRDSFNVFQDKASNLQKQFIIVLGVIQIASFIYDISVICCLRKHIFSKIKKQDNANFIDKFKQLSEYRILISILISIIFIPFLLYIIINIVIIKKDNYDVNDDESKKLLFNDKYNQIDGFRQIVVDVNYTFMFIDQILLRFCAERTNPKYKRTSTNSYIYHPNSSKYSSDNQKAFSNVLSNNSSSQSTPLLSSPSNNYNSNNTSFNDNYNSVSNIMLMIGDSFNANNDVNDSILTPNSILKDNLNKNLSINNNNNNNNNNNINVGINNMNNTVINNQHSYSKNNNQNNSSNGNLNPIHHNKYNYLISSLSSVNSSISKSELLNKKFIQNGLTLSKPSNSYHKY